MRTKFSVHYRHNNSVRVANPYVANIITVVPIKTLLITDVELFAQLFYLLLRKTCKFDEIIWF